MDTPTPSPPRQALLDNVAFWRAQSRQLEHDRSRLRYLLPLGPAAGALLYVVGHNPFAGACVGGLALVTWALGLYMTTVRREEYAFALGAAEAELATSPRAVPAPGDATPRAAPAPTAPGPPPPPRA